MTAGPWYMIRRESPAHGRMLWLNITREPTSDPRGRIRWTTDPTAYDVFATRKAEVADRLAVIVGGQTVTVGWHRRAHMDSPTS